MDWLIKLLGPSAMTVVLLVISNVFMTFAWYGNLKMQQAGITKNWPLVLVILLSWGIALIEYFFLVPANRIGFFGTLDNVPTANGPYSLVQLKVMQEAITLIVFTVIVTFMFQGTAIRWNHLAAFLLLIGAVYLVFME